MPAHDRTRWPDEALDLLKESVDDTENELLSLKELPAALAAMAVKVDTHTEALREVKEAAVRAEAAEVRRIEALRRDLELALRRIDGRFDRSDEDHRQVVAILNELRTTVAAGGKSETQTTAELAPAKSPRQAPAARRIDWPTVLVVAGTITVPIVGALIAVLARG